MKTYHVIQSNGLSYVMQCETLYEVDAKFYMHETALRLALNNNRPLSLIVGKQFRQTMNQSNIPRVMFGQKFLLKKVL